MPLDKSWQKLLEQEEKLLAGAEKKEKRKEEKTGKVQTIVSSIEDKIPGQLVSTLEAAFGKAFDTIFTKGIGVIEKAFQAEAAALEFQVNDFRMEQKATKKAIRQVEKAGKKSRMVNSCMTTVEGIGLGALGIGLPDIPIFLAMLLKGLYETAISYGYDYKREREQVFLLRIIQGAMATGEEKRRQSQALDTYMKALETGTVTYDFEKEVQLAAKSLSQGMLLSKFVQGFLVVGAVGGAMNLVIYRQVMDYALLKYKKRYFMKKRKEV